MTLALAAIKDVAARDRTLVQETITPLSGRALGTLSDTTQGVSHLVPRPGSMLAYHFALSRSMFIDAGFYQLLNNR